MSNEELKKHIEKDIYHGIKTNSVPASIQIEAINAVIDEALNSNSIAISELTDEEIDSIWNE